MLAQPCRFTAELPQPFFKLFKGFSHTQPYQIAMFYIANHTPES
jgi:hypothetical protein